MAETIEGRDDYPRISIDSIQDWQRIKMNYVSAAMKTLDYKLVEQGLTNQRDLFVRYIMQFVESAFVTSKPNLRINGRNYEDYNEDEEEAEQFDEALDRCVWSLSDQRRNWDLEIAKKRRTTPQEVETLMRDLIVCQREHDATAAASLNAPDMDVGVDIDIDNVGTTNNMTKVHEDIASLSAVLIKSVPEQLERSHRVQQIDKDIRSLKL